MKKHTGMRPHDIVVLAQLANLNNSDWLMKDLAYSLKISSSEISESLNRSAIAGLVSANKKSLMKTAFYEFIIYGLRYVFPQRPGALTGGIATAHSALPMKKFIISDEPYVWACSEGDLRGQMLIPLHPNVPNACLKNPGLYEILSLIDVMRIGKAREMEIAMNELKERIL